MTRGAAITVENSFTQGLITEFTAMNFPENAVTEGDNCVFSELGAVTRRLGMDYENGFVMKSIGSYNLSSEDNALVEYKWHSVGNDGTIQFLVQQIGYVIYFFSVGEESSLSSGKKNFLVDLRSYEAPGVNFNDVRVKPCQFTSGKGMLFVVHPNCEPLVVTYNSDSDTITIREVTIEIRDFEGLDDDLATDTRPSTLSAYHKYNLYNQGWYISAIVEGSTPPQPVLPSWDSVRDDFPSNADIWWLFKNASEIAYFGENYHEGSVSPSQVNMGNTPAPRGHYLYNAFNIDRTASTGIAGLPTLSAGASRPSAIAWYAGRVFYAGVNQNQFSDKIYFTQIIESNDQLGRCYQVNDPTSETIFDLLDTDGGVISLPLIETVISMKVVSDALIVVGTNAVYVIRGTDNGPFRATDYTVEYVSSIGGTSHSSIIEVDAGLMWINYDAIYALTKDQTGIFFGVSNVSKSTIQTLINSIPDHNKSFIKGAYNKKDQIVQWLFSDDEELTGYRFNRILELNIISKAFYTFTIDLTAGPHICGVTTVSGQRQVLENEPVRVSGVIVTDSLGTTYTVVQDFVPNSELFKYTTRVGDLGLTYSELWDVNHLDWNSSGTGVPYISYGHSGYRIRGDFLRKFNSTPIIFLVEYDPDGRCEVSGIWDYGFRNSVPQELYLTRPEVGYLIRRVKLRGKGHSLQIKFQSVGNAPFTLVGWSSFDTGGTMP